MTANYKFGVFVLASFACAACLPGLAIGQESSDAQRGMERVSPPEIPVETYAKRWAVIVGINYSDIELGEDDRKVVPQLRNAENDAQAVADLLIKHYGYEEDCIRVLIGKEATHSAILSAIGDNFLRNKSKVTDKDSVLFFFAGHGVHLEKEKRSGELIPWDVKIAGDIPAIESCIKLQAITDDYLKASPARHKLIILDCCHSGDIFTQSSQANRRIYATLRSDAGLFRTPAFQAIASCRREQQASDGKGGHAPFTASLLSALTVIPRQQGTRDPIKASDLFTFMQAELQSAPSIDQSADLGWLSPDQGEFHFFPDPKSDFSGYSSHTDDEMLKAIAMAPGTYGAWWFDEMPWFMPSLRSRILANVETPRSTAADWVKKHQLEESAREVLRALENEQGELGKLRVRHLKLLLDPATRQDSDSAYTLIANALREPPKGIVLEASDLHLLAVIEHRLGGQAREVYDKALAAYDAGLKSGRKQDAALRLLCLADLGQFEFQENDCEQAALQFQRALEKRVLCPVPFQIYVLCCEANAWRQLGRWGEADTKLDQALRLATPLAENRQESPLTAYVYIRRAWSCMDQWKFREAAEAFARADDHLPRDEDREAAIIRFHNRHGLAMASRFTGDPEGALAEYRQISVDIRDIFSKLRQDSGIERNFGEIRERLADRLVNTLERQADCNLFRENGDLREASDDLRRAIRVTVYLPPSRQNPTKAAQFYKQVLALSRRSPFQDLELAAGFLRDAEALNERLNDKQQRGLDYYRKVATAIYNMAVASDGADDELGGRAARREKQLAAAAVLRNVITELRPQLNRSIQRDNLELLLSAGQYLISEDHEVADRYQLLNDAEILLLLCRHAMRSEPLVTQRYLRQYFDTVIRAMIVARPKHVQGLIEAVYESRSGRHYDKPAIPVPSLVLYRLDGRLHAFLDVPNNGISKSYTFDEGVTEESLREAESTHKQLSLPRQLTEDLAILKLDKVYFPESTLETAAETGGCLHVSWHDPYYLLGSIAPAPVIAAEFSGGTRTVVAKRVPIPITTFPFTLPDLELPEPTLLPPKPLSPPKE